MNTKLRIALAVAAPALATACGGDDGGIEGSYRHEEEGTVEILGDGDATLTQSGNPVELTYEVDGDTVTFEAPNGSSIDAEVTDEGLVFEEDAFNQEGRETFEKVDD